jgi:hypothetical protein
VLNLFGGKMLIMQEIVICAVYTSDISACPEQKKFTKSRDIRLVHQCIARANKNSIAEEIIILFQHTIPASR